MRCERCEGTGKIAEIKRLGNSDEVAQGPWVPCPDCNGSGIGHCCDGLQAQCDKPGA